MFDSLQPLQHVTKADILLTGSWVADEYGRHIWQGEATAQENIVGIIFLTCGNRVAWAKSNDLASNQLPIEIWPQPLRATDQGEISVQLICFIGHYRNTIDNISTVFSSIDAVPEIPTSSNLQTGQLNPLAEFASLPVTTLYVLFLAKKDIKVRRKHVWGLHDKFLATLTPPLVQVLKYRRRGNFILPTGSPF